LAEGGEVRDSKENVKRTPSFRSIITSTRGRKGHAKNLRGREAFRGFMRNLGKKTFEARQDGECLSPIILGGLYAL